MENPVENVENSALSTFIRRRFHSCEFPEIETCARRFGWDEGARGTVTLPPAAGVKSPISAQNVFKTRSREKVPGETRPERPKNL